MPSVDERLAAIEARNTKVEMDKAWETSLSRRALICLISYLSCGFLLVFLGSTAAWLYAFIPVIGYFVSTLSLPLFRSVWQRHVFERRNKKRETTSSRT